MHLARTIARMFCRCWLLIVVLSQVGQEARIPGTKTNRDPVYLQNHYYILVRACFVKVRKSIVPLERFIDPFPISTLPCGVQCIYKVREDAKRCSRTTNFFLLHFFLFPFLLHSATT